MNKKLIIAAYFVVGIFITNLAAADEVLGQIVVIVNKDNSVSNLSKTQLLNIYLGKDIVWKNQSRIYPVTPKTNQSVTKTFFEKGLSKSVGRVKRIWVKLSLSGKTSPPKILNSPAKIVEYISENEGAIGFIPLENLDGRVKAVNINSYAYNEKEYFLIQKTE